MDHNFDNFLDCETGEKKAKVICCDVKKFGTNAETGEPEIPDKVRRRKTFQIPDKYLEQSFDNRGFRYKTRKKLFPEFYIQRKKIRSKIFKSMLLSQKSNVSPFVFVLPTFLIFPTWASIICLLWEACMHIWSHKRNKRIKNNSIEYRSPLHLLTSQFCIRCRFRKWKKKVSEIHKKRAIKRKILHQIPVKYQAS